MIPLELRTKLREKIHDSFLEGKINEEHVTSLIMYLQVGDATEKNFQALLKKLEELEKSPQYKRDYWITAMSMIAILLSLVALIVAYCS